MNDHAQESVLFVSDERICQLLLQIVRQLQQISARLEDGTIRIDGADELRAALSTPIQVVNGAAPAPASTPTVPRRTPSRVALESSPAGRAALGAAIAADERAEIERFVAAERKTLAIKALVALGWSKSDATKGVENVLANEPNYREVKLDEPEPVAATDIVAEALRRRFGGH